MGFLSGRVTIARYRIDGQAPGIFGPEHLSELKKRSAGRDRLASADGVEVGWTAGDHVLDTRFELEKNVINESLQFCLRVDSTKIPSDLLQAYYQIELHGQRAGKKPSSKQKKAAKAAALERLEHEAKDGRFTRRKVVPILWDAKSNELLVGTTSMSAIDQLYSLFELTFGFGFEALTAGRQAYRLAEMRQQTRGVDDATSSPFVPGLTPNDLAWIVEEDSRDFLGNEFLLWLWYRLESESDTVKLSDGSEVAVMLSRTLTLECPRGQTGHETISSEGPTRLPESRRAIQAGKLPRKVGLTMVRHEKQYDFTLHAETLAVGACKMPPPELEEERPRLEERIDQIRQLVETLDLLYDAFGRLRHGQEWNSELTKMQKWLVREETKKR
jgi:hypothetical protein